MDPYRRMFPSTRAALGKSSTATNVNCNDSWALPSSPSSHTSSTNPSVKQWNGPSGPLSAPTQARTPSGPSPPRPRPQPLTPQRQAQMHLPYRATSRPKRRRTHPWRSEPTVPSQRARISPGRSTRPSGRRPRRSVGGSARPRAGRDRSLGWGSGRTRTRRVKPSNGSLFSFNTKFGWAGAGRFMGFMRPALELVC